MTSPLRFIVIAIVFVMLIAGNVVTLTNHRVQSQLHDWLAASVGNMIDMTGSTVSRGRAAEKENGRLRVEKQQLVVAMATLTATVTALHTANEILGRQNQLLAKGQIATAQQNGKRVIAAHSLFARVFPRVVGGALRNMGSLVSRSIPYAGILASLTFTGLDVKDACATLNDLNELAVEFGERKADQSTICGYTPPSLGELRRMLP